MAKIKDFIRRYFAGVKAAKLSRHEAEISARFRITERGGKIYLLCYGTAVAVISDNSNAAEITRQIKSARNAALDYDQESMVRNSIYRNDGNE